MVQTLNSHSRVIGDFRLRRTLRRIHETMPNQLRAAMQTITSRILETQRAMIPKDTGRGVSALTAFVSKSGFSAEVGIRGKKKKLNFYYLRFLEYGTKGYSGPKKSGNRNRSKKMKFNNGIFYGVYPEIPARPARPWLRPSFDLNRERTVAEIRKAIDDTLARAAAGGGNG